MCCIDEPEGFKLRERLGEEVGTASQRRDSKMGKALSMGHQKGNESRGEILFMIIYEGNLQGQALREG